MPGRETPGSPPVLATLGAAVRARREARGAVVFTIQLLLVLLWFVLAALHGSAMSTTGPASSTVDWLATMLAKVVAGAGLLGFVAFVPFRFVARHVRSPLAMFVRCWWWTCMLGSFPLLAYMALGAVAPESELLHEAALMSLYGWLVIGPALFARAELPPAHQRVSWRPACPECGYSLRRLARNNCPECGETLPTSARTFRRWARQRLSWDRSSRGSLLVAYLKTIFAIACSPWAAAPRLAMPDRFGRAIRWAIAHVLLAALIGLALGSHSYFASWLQSQFDEQGDLWWWAGQFNRPSVARMATWAAESLSAWLIVIVLYPALGVLLALAVPGRRPAARWGLVKWSLYLACLYAPGLIADLGISYALSLHSGALRGNAALLGGYLASEVSKPPGSVWFASIYGVWWALGASANPYLRERGLRTFLLNAGGFVGAWYVLVRLLFPAAEFRSLL